MPIYEYECGACGEEHEVIQKISDGLMRKCPSCGALKLRRRVSRSAFQLKGSGWYATDYARKSSGKSAEVSVGSNPNSEKTETSKAVIK